MSESRLTDFAAGYSFPLDGFQNEACGHLLDGQGVLVAAPTGSGKTVVGEFAVWLALQEGRKCFYTTPIKALSNQKYHDLVARHGADNVGLLTGDMSVNGEAPVVVMTTEVLRNMIYAGSSTLSGLGYVVMDEVHYLADRFRGAVWEEVILGLADSVQLVALSATVSNAEEFGEWLGEVRVGGVAVVVSETRPVPLYQHVMVGDHLVSLFDKQGQAVNPTLMRYALVQAQQLKARGPRRYGRGGGGRRPRDDKTEKLTPTRLKIVTELHRADLLPAIVFIFSRAGCDGAVRQLLASGVRLTDKHERAELLEIAERHGAALGYADREAIGWTSFVAALANGIAAHHAGLLPLVKAIVEEGFTKGLVKVVFATETLALGINMPARTVVLEKLVKFNGESRVEITPGEYTQLTGRAGRRGIDVEGHAVVAWSRALQPKMVAGLAAKRTYPLRSSFAPNYNMAVNLVARLGHVRARELLAHSFAQFQADKEKRRYGSRGYTIAEQFDQVCAVLEELGYTSDDALTAHGKMLTRIYCERDLLVAQAIRAGVFGGLTAPQLAAVLSCLVYESRGDQRGPEKLPDPASERAVVVLRHMLRDLGKVERAQHIAPQPRLAAGFARAAHAWCAGESLAEVLAMTGLAAGDFVRWVRQVVDLAAQLIGAPGVGPVRDVCREVVERMRRDIVDIDADEE